MATQAEIVYVGATQLVVGVSSILKVQPSAYSFGYNLKLFSGSSLEFVNSCATLTGTGATGWGTGYLIGSSESVTFDGPATFYLAATGATAVVHCLMGKTAGASFS